MIKAGMNVARLNFSHGDYSSHQKLIASLRAAAKQTNESLALLQDLQGPRIRVGNLSKAGARIKKGETIILHSGTLNHEPGPTQGRTPTQRRRTKNVVPIEYKKLAQEVKKNSTILIEDGTIELKVEKVQGQKIYCLVRTDGLILSHKGLNIPGVTLSAPAITAKDKKDLAFGIKNEVDYVALSFVKSAKDVVQLRQLIKKLEKKHRYKVGAVNKYQNKEETNTKIIAKIERPEAYKDIDNIIKAVDGIMVARGDLALEVGNSKVPTMQKEMIKKCNLASKPVIVATQMLDSMIENPLPTRAEVSDVANAIMDGTDAVMLSGETATGKYPVKVVQQMTKIAQQTEKYFIKEKLENIRIRLEGDVDDQEAVGFAAVKIAEEIGAKAIITATTSGFTARSVSAFKPKVPIYAFSPFALCQRQLNLLWGTKPQALKLVKSIDTLIDNTAKQLKNQKLLKSGDKVIIAIGSPFKARAKDSFIRVFQV